MIMVKIGIYKNKRRIYEKKNIYNFYNTFISYYCYIQYYNSSFLINNGYIKKEELKDVDDKSYCDVYVKIDPYFEDPQDQMHNCETSYKIFLKCKNLTDKGYIDWGN